MEELKSVEAFNEAVNTENPVIIDLFAPWCGPCKMVAPILDSVDCDNKYKVDVDALPELAQQFGVTTVPTVLILKSGDVQETLVGVQMKAVYEDKLKAL